MAEALPKRGAIACRRCRRLRTRCINEGDHEGHPPCAGCARVNEACSFLRGNSMLDRKDAPRPRKTLRPNPWASSAANLSTDFSPPTRSAPIPPPYIPSGRQELDPLPPRTTSLDLPPDNEIAEACSVYFVRHYQVGFLHRATFMQRLAQKPMEVPHFLLCGMLAVTASTTPSIVARFGGAEAASAHFLELARAAGNSELGDISLENCQAWYLLALVDWSSGSGARSAMSIGLALRMAYLLKLENHESYPEATTSAQQIEGESARRTLWSILTADDCLSSSDWRPSNNVLSYLTIPLPCDEDDWNFGSISPTLGPLPAPGSLMGNLTYINSIWCRAARRASSNADPNEPVPWSPESDFSSISQSLEAWRTGLSPRLKWSLPNLAGHIGKNLDMPYAFAHLLSHATDILLRRVYLPHFISYSPFHQQRSAPPPVDPALQAFWHTSTIELFESCRQILHIATEYAEQGGKINFSPLMGFCVFLSGSMLSFLLKTPWLSPSHAPSAATLVQSALRVLKDLCPLWAMAGGWFQRLSAMAEGAPAGESPSSHNNSSNQHSLNLLTDLALGAGADLSPKNSEDVQPSPAAQEEQGVEPYSPNHPALDGLALPFINFDDLLAFTQGTSALDDSFTWAWS